MSDECPTCGYPAVGIASSTGGIREGPFVERYECERCGAQGVIEGDAADPDTWTRRGEVFES